jgi:hypothetical protein
VEDPNIEDHVQKIFSKFQIIVMWDTNFVRICNLSKSLNKDCDLGTKPSYRENLTHAFQIWDTYEWTCPNLDASLRHFNEYKVFKYHIMLCNIPLFLLLLLIILVLLLVV